MGLVKSGCLILSLFIIGLYGCTMENQTIQNITVSEAQQIIEENKENINFLVIDVRTPEEYNEGHIEGAVNIDIYAADFKDRLSQLNIDKKYLVHCRSGSRSNEATNMMKDLEFKEVYHMNEGILGWQEKNLPLVK